MNADVSPKRALGQHFLVDPNILRVIARLAKLDGEDVVFMTSADTIKGKAILRDGRVALCWDDERPPFSFVTVSGIATTSTDPDELLHWASRIAGRYMGDEQAEQYGRRNAVPPEIVVRVTPAKVVATVAVAD